MKKLKVALLQLTPCEEENAALSKGLDYARRAADQGAEIILFPEMWNIGYALPESEGDVDRW